MKISSIEIWNDDKIIFLDENDFQLEVNDIESFEYFIADTLEMEQPEKDFILHNGLTQFHEEVGMLEYINELIDINEIGFIKHTHRIGESEHERVLRITFYRNDLVLKKDKITRSFGSSNLVTRIEKKIKNADNYLEILK